MPDVLVIWEYWSELPNNGGKTLCHRNRIAVNFEHAVRLAYALKTRHGNNLLVLV